MKLLKENAKLPRRNLIPAVVYPNNLLSSNLLPAHAPFQASFIGMVKAEQRRRGGREAVRQNSKKKKKNCTPGQTWNTVTDS